MLNQWSHRFFPEQYNFLSNQMTKTLSFLFASAESKQGQGQGQGHLYIADFYTKTIRFMLRSSLSFENTILSYDWLTYFVILLGTLFHLFSDVALLRNANWKRISLKSRQSTIQPTEKNNTYAYRSTIYT